MPAGSEPITEVWAVVHTESNEARGVGITAHGALTLARIPFGAEAALLELLPVRPDHYAPSYAAGGYDLRRLPLATPEMVAVMEAAIAYRRCTLHEIGDNYGCEQDDAYDALIAAIDTARAAGGMDG